MKMKSLLLSLAAAAACVTSAYSVPLTGTVVTPPGTTVFPGLVPAGTSSGTLIVGHRAPFTYTTSAGTTSGFSATAVFREDSGTLDFIIRFRTVRTRPALSRG